MRRFVGPALLFVAAAVSAPRSAHACGGTFCDNAGPQSMPVDQRGENILFVLDGQSVEAHIQIQYMGNALRFAWILPVQALPEFSVGSQALFSSLLASTVPTYGYTTQNTCAPPPNADATGSAAGGASSAGGGKAGAGGGLGTGPQVVYQATVGAFDVTVLQGGTADEVEQWLVANQYAPSPDAPPILEQYLQEGYLFVAMKLTNGAGVDEIHPIVIKYPGNKPCVPIRLTRVAALDDMAIRTFFLANERAVPTNYKHVVPNALRLDWLAYANNYDQVVSSAIDSPVADGHAFVTEYAGPSNVVPPSGVDSPYWNAAPFATIAPEMVVSELQAQGLVQCNGSTYCAYDHPLVAGLLHEFLPVPAGVQETAFYGCLSCYKDLIDKTAWDATKFASAMDQRIVQPGSHARAILATYPYLTRMLTRISPLEMNVDPDFSLRADLGDVIPQQTASRTLGCSCESVSLPDGRVVAMSGTGLTWPAWPDDMPWAERIEDLSGDAPIVLVDNTAAIDALLAKANAAVTCNTSANGGAPGSTGPGGTTSVGGRAGSPAAGFGANAAASSASPSPSSSAPDDGSGGCAIVAPWRSGPAAIFALFGLVAAAAGLRRKGVA